MLLLLKRHLEFQNKTKGLYFKFVILQTNFINIYPWLLLPQCVTTIFEMKHVNSAKAPLSLRISMNSTFSRTQDQNLQTGFLIRLENNKKYKTLKYRTLYGRNKCIQPIHILKKLRTTVYIRTVNKFVSFLFLLYSKYTQIGKQKYVICYASKVP